MDRAADRAVEPPARLLRCPRCRVDLVPDERGGGCSKCRGVFIDHARLRALVSDADANRSGKTFRPRRRYDPDIRSFPCASCGEDMQRSAFGPGSGIYLDACRAHGTWFDVDELDDALDRVRAVGLERAMAPPPAAPANRPSSKASSTSPAVLRAGLDIELEGERARDAADARDLTRLARYDLVGFIFRLIR